MPWRRVGELRARLSRFSRWLFEECILTHTLCQSAELPRGVDRWATGRVDLILAAVRKAGACETASRSRDLKDNKDRYTQGYATRGSADGFSASGERWQLEGPGLGAVHPGRGEWLRDSAAGTSPANRPTPSCIRRAGSQ